MQRNYLHSAQDPDKKRCTFWQDRGVQICQGSGKEMSDILTQILVLAPSGYDPDWYPQWILIGSDTVLLQEDLELLQKNPRKDPEWSGQNLGSRNYKDFEHDHDLILLGSCSIRILTESLKDLGWIGSWRIHERLLSSTDQDMRLFHQRYRQDPVQEHTTSMQRKYPEFLTGSSPRKIQILAGSCCSNLWRIHQGNVIQSWQDPCHPPCYDPSWFP